MPLQFVLCSLCVIILLLNKADVKDLQADVVNIPNVHCEYRNQYKRMVSFDSSPAKRNVLDEAKPKPNQHTELHVHVG